MIKQLLRRMFASGGEVMPLRIGAERVFVWSETRQGYVQIASKERNA